MNVGKQLKLVVVAGIALSLLSVASVTAIAREDGTPVEANEDGIMLMNAQARAETATSTLEERLAQRKAAIPTTLTNAQTTRLRARCVAAQTKLTALQKRADTALTARATAYQTIQERLSNLATKLENADLDASLTTLGEKITAFETAAATYKQTLADVAEVGCVADTAGFKASLEAAKTEQVAVKDAAAAIRTHLQENIKPLLETIKSTLQAREAN